MEKDGARNRSLTKNISRLTHLKLFLLIAFEYVLSNYTTLFMPFDDDEHSLIDLIDSCPRAREKHSSHAHTVVDHHYRRDSTLMMMMAISSIANAYTTYNKQQYANKIHLKSIYYAHALNMQFQLIINCIHYKYVRYILLRVQL